MEAVAKRDPLIGKAVARLMDLSADEKTRLLYEAREKERMDNESREDWARTEERAKWQGVVNKKDAALAEQAALIANLRARLGE